MARTKKQEKLVNDRMAAVAVLDERTLDSVKNALNWAAAMASTLDEHPEDASPVETALIGAIVEGRCRVALARIEHAELVARQQSGTPKSSARARKWPVERAKK